MPSGTNALVLVCLAAAGASAAPKAWEAGLRGSDIVYSERALKGARVALIEAPRRHAAGVAVPVGVATLYGGHLSNDVSHHRSGHAGKGETEGRKTGHWDTNDDRDDDQGSRNQGRADNGGDGDRSSGQPLDRELISNPEFGDGLAHWESRSAYVTSSFGPITASELSRDGIFAVAHTGYSDSNNLGYIEQAIPVPMARNALFSMLYNFVSAEYPDWQGTQYNDYFQVTLTGPSGEKTLTKAEFLNSSSFSPVTGLPAGVVDGWFPGDIPVLGGQTGWSMYNQSALPLKNGIYKLRIEVRDVGDNIVDSAILVDRVSLR